MEYNFSLPRILILAGCLGLFALLGGFTPPAASESSQNVRQKTKAWTYCMALFVVGAAAVSVVDHITGTIHPTNLRPAYIVLGVLLMVAGALWLRALKSQAPEATGVISQQQLVQWT